MHPDDYCRAAAVPPGSDLHYSLLGLTPVQRQAVTAVYALRRELNNIAAKHTDVPRDDTPAQHRLDWWRHELEQNLPGGRAQHPVSRALSPHLRRYRLPHSCFQELLDAAQTDLDYQAYPGFQQLLVYCHRAGSSVALLHSEILGYQQQQTRAFAHEAGVAWLLLQQLCRVRDDAHRGYFYIPEDELQRFEVRHDDLLQTRNTPALRELFRFQAQRIRDYWQRALEHLPATDRYAQRSQLILVELGLTLLDEIETDGFRLLQRRLSVTPLRKLWIAWRLLRRETRRRRASTSPTATQSESKPV